MQFEYESEAVKNAGTAGEKAGTCHTACKKTGTSIRQPQTTDSCQQSREPGQSPRVSDKTTAQLT